MSHSQPNQHRQFGRILYAIYLGGILVVCVGSIVVLTSGRGTWQLEEMASRIAYAPYEAWNDRLDQAKQLVQDGRARNARSELESLLADLPELRHRNYRDGLLRFEVSRQLANLYLADDSRRRASELLTQMIDGNVGRSYAERVYGQALLAWGQYHDGERLLLKTLATYSDDTPAAESLVAFYATRGRHADVLKTYEMYRQAVAVMHFSRLHLFAGDEVLGAYDIYVVVDGVSRLIEIPIGPRDDALSSYSVDRISLALRPGTRSGRVDLGALRVYRRRDIRSGDRPLALEIADFSDARLTGPIERGERPGEFRFRSAGPQVEISIPLGERAFPFASTDVITLEITAYKRVSTETERHVSVARLAVARERGNKASP